MSKIFAHYWDILYPFQFLHFHPNPFPLQQILSKKISDAHIGEGGGEVRWGIACPFLKIEKSVALIKSIYY